MQQKLVRVDRELHRKAKAYASLNQESLKELTEKALRDYMERNPGQAA